MSADARTCPLFYTPSDVRALALDLAAPERLALFLSALRERHARVAALPIPVPAKPISIIHENQDRP